jgi:hypothetical protein
VQQYEIPLQTKSAQRFEGVVSTSGRAAGGVDALRSWAFTLAGCRGDATPFYFGTRLIVRGDHSYDLSVLHAEWEKSRLVGNTQAALSPLVKPPSISVLVAPIAVVIALLTQLMTMGALDIRRLGSALPLHPAKASLRV